MSHNNMTVALKSKQEIAEEDLKMTCWINGLSISSLSRRLGYARGTMYFALRWPDRYPIAYRKICDALPKRINTND